MKDKIWNRSNRFVFMNNVLASLLLEIYLEWLERRSFSGVLSFVDERTFVFLYDCLIIFISLLPVFLVHRKKFVFIFISAVWALIGTANGVVLSTRKTPFTAVDLTILKSILPVLPSYLKMWQIVLLAAAIFGLIVACVCLFLYGKPSREPFDSRVNAVIAAVFLAFFSAVTYFGVGQNRLIGKFDNLITGYEDYGVVYGFCVTAIDTGIDRPLNYSGSSVRKLIKKMNKEIRTAKKKEDKKNSREPNIIFIQLESFFDATAMKNLAVSEDPIPTFHRIQEEYTSGYLKVPVYGAGTINTEFEVITGMNVHYFGTGEYPYRSILHKKNCDSVARWMSSLGYATSVIHNNNASFYDRDLVFSNLGFDNFITSENMDIRSKNEVGWAKDEILTKYIIDTLQTTEEKDMIYTISVQGHGDYPDGDQSDAQIQVTGEEYDQSYLNQFTYYVNEISEMDQFLADLLEKLEDYPEDTMVIAYGDHLPGLNIESEDLENGNRFQTPYFIWDNFGYNSANKKEESGNVTAYELAAKVLSEVNIHTGTLNRFHQTQYGKKNYKENLKLLQYDMLYGSNFAGEKQDPLESTTIQFALDPIRIIKVKEDGKYYYLIGENYTDASRLYVNGIVSKSEKLSSTVIRVKKSVVKDGDELVIHQVSSTNENITLNTGETYTMKKKEVTPLYRDGRPSEEKE